MEALLCLAALLVGGAGGYFIGRAAPGIRTNIITAAERLEDNRLNRQYQNFLTYDGTERGQTNLEDRN